MSDEIAETGPEAASSPFMPYPGSGSNGGGSPPAPFVPGVTPYGAPSEIAFALLASQQGVLLDAFRLASDVDDTNAMIKASAAGVPILLGPRTYFVNNFSTGIIPSFVLLGVKGVSKIQRTNGSSGSQFFRIRAALVICDGVIFDMNKAVVTANQWGVFCGQGAQTILFSNCGFLNNSGSISIGLTIQSTSPNDGGTFKIINCEASGNVASVGGAIYIAGASHGIIENNYVHDNTGAGIFVQVNGAVSSTNYLTDVLICKNRVVRQGNNGISIGGYAAPFIYPTDFPPVTHITAEDNVCVDNSSYGILAEGDYINIINNQVYQSSPSVSCFGGIVGPGRYGKVTGNTVTFTNVLWGIDWGGGIEMELTDNTITMTIGAALNCGASLNMKMANNHIMVSGTASAITSENYEFGGNASFPLYTSGSIIEENIISMSGGSCFGITMRDNSGGAAGCTATQVRNNNFFQANSGDPGKCISWYGSSESAIIDGNKLNGTNILFVDPNGNGDIVFPTVYFGGTIQGLTSTANIRSFIPDVINNNFESILYVTPVSGGTNYNLATTTVAASGSGGGSGWTGQAMIIGGVIVGVRTLSFGSSYSGTVTITATDSSGAGSGATFTVGMSGVLPRIAKLRYVSQVKQLVQRSGGLVATSGGPLQLSANTIDLVTSTNGAITSWTVVNATQAVLTAAQLTAASATSAGAEAIVSDALTPTYGGVLVGGGTTRVHAIADSANWRTF